MLKSLFWALGILLLIIFFLYIWWLNPLLVSLRIPLFGVFHEIPLIVLLFLSLLAGMVLTSSIVLIKEVGATFSHWNKKREQKRRKKLAQLYEKGIQLFKQEKPQEAISCLKEVIALNPQHLNACLGLGDIYFSLGQLEPAIEYHSSGYRLAPNDITVLAKLQQDHEKKGDLPAAIHLLKQMLENKRDPLNIYTKIRDLQLKLSRWKEAYATQQKICTLVKSSSAKELQQQYLAGIRCEQAKQLAAEEKYPEALKIYKEVINDKKNFIPSYLGLAQLLQKLNKDDEAIKLLLKGYKVTSSVIILQELERFYLERELPEKIIQLYKTALDKIPEQQELHLLLGRLYLRLEMVAEAKEELISLKQRGIVSFWLQLLVAELYEKSDKLEAACREYRQLLQSLSGLNNNYRCSNCYHSLSQWEGRCPNCGQWNTISLNFLQEKTSVPPSPPLLLPPRPRF